MWNIIGQPVGRWIEPDDETDDEATDSNGNYLNNSHMAIVLVRQGQREVISRVAFIRRLSRNPDVPFDQQVKAEIEKARKARDAMAELLGDTETLR